MTDTAAIDIIRNSGIYALIDEAHLCGRRTIKIPRTEWESLRPLVQRLCREHFREISRPWQQFMLDGIWIEAA